MGAVTGSATLVSQIAFACGRERDLDPAALPMPAQTAVRAVGPRLRCTAGQEGQLHLDGVLLLVRLSVHAIASIVRRLGKKLSETINAEFCKAASSRSVASHSASIM